MPKMHIRLRVDPETGERRVLVDYESDEDALPAEHEAEHKRLVDAVLADAPKTELEVRREGAPAVETTVESEEESAPQALSESEP